MFQLMLICVFIVTIIACRPFFLFFWDPVFEHYRRGRAPSQFRYLLVQMGTDSKPCREHGVRREGGDLSWWCLAHQDGFVFCVGCCATDGTISEIA